MNTSRSMLALAAAFSTSLALMATPEPAQQQALNLAEQLENAFSAVAEKAKPSVVVITNIQYAGANMVIPQMDFEDFFFNPYVQPRRSPRRGQYRKLEPSSSGSGVIVSNDGYVVTNCHVIENSEFLRVKLADGTIYDNQKNDDDVTIVGMDKESDLAVLQLAKGKKKDFKALKFADISKVKVGQWAIAVGAPHQLEQSVTFGNVSQVGRHNMGITTFDNYIQTDASLNPGNSGGPLLNIRGEIIGINEFIHTDGMGQGNIGLGFAIACDLAESVSKSLIEYGEVKRPFLGISMQELSPELKKSFNAENGVIVAEAIRGEAAEKAGVKEGDIITAINGKKINDSYALRTAVTLYKPGDALKLDIIRDGKTMQITVITGKRDIADNSFKGKNNRNNDEATADFDTLGIMLEADDDVVYIKDIDPDGAAAKAASRQANALRVGDVILDVNHKSIESISDVKKALKKSKNNIALFLIERKIRGDKPLRCFVSVPLD